MVVHQPAQVPQRVLQHYLVVVAGYERCPRLLAMELGVLMRASVSGEVVTIRTPD